MQYMLAIYGDERAAESTPRERMNEIINAYMAYTKALQEAGVFVGGAGLQPPDTATVVKVRGGQRHVQDGPYAETKEQLGGYYMLQCKNLDEAIEFAAKIPGARYASIEIRPVMEWE